MKTQWSRSQNGRSMTVRTRHEDDSSPRFAPPPRLRKQGAPCALAVSLALSGLAGAQEVEQLEEIQVTGTRIIRSGVNTPTPVTMVSRDELNAMAPGMMIESLNSLPQFAGNIAPDQITTGQTGGGSNLNLRGAGVNRTLVLLDGRRVVPSNRFGTVDVSVFPEQLVNRVETVTGGGSASYGTDAVAGVVNFILDTEFTGFSAHSQWGQTHYGDGDSYEVGLAFGTNLGDRFHIMASAERFQQDSIDTFESLQDRDFYKQRARVTNPDASGPREITRPFVSPTNYTNTGIINQPGSALDKMVFQPDGSVRPLEFSGIGQLRGGCNCQAEPTQSYGVDADTQVQAGFERTSIFLHSDYEVSESLNFYAQGLYGESEIKDRRESVALLGPWEARVFADNPLLPEEVRQTMADEGLESVGFGVFALNMPDTPLGESYHPGANELYSVTGGFEMQLPPDAFLADWRINGYYQYGRNIQDYNAHNGVRVDRFPMALDVVEGPQGQPVCRVTLFNPGIFDDCAPLNLFGGVQNASSAAAAFMMDDGKTSRQWTRQRVAELVLTGEIWQGFGAGSVAGAFGGSYREETLYQRTLNPADEFPATTDDVLLSDLGLMPAGLRGVIPESEGGVPGLRHVPNGFKGDANSSSVLFSSLREIQGGFDVKELFGELNIPVVADQAFARELEVDTAARWADYAGSGEIWAWKLGLNWLVVDDVRIRATRSHDVRAATLLERFDSTRGGTSVQDPENNFATINTASFSGGNPNVSPEEADTTTIGVVYQPSFLDGFAVSADWYEIDLDDAIGQLSSQNVVEGCFQGDQSLCQFVFRDPGTNQIVRVDNLFINLANQRISGVDLELNYTRDLELFGGGAESIRWRFFGTWLEENSIQNPGAARDDRAGQVGSGFDLPKYKVTSNISYGNGPISVFLQGRWVDGGVLDRFRTEGVDLDDNSVPSAFYTDMNLSYASQGPTAWELFFNVTNLFDREPPPTPGTVGRTGTNEFNTSLHDVLGRRYVLGARINF